MTSVRAFVWPARAATSLFTLLIVCVRAHAQTDPLPSWNDGPAKQAIVEFVKTTTDRASPQFVPPEERIATFDQDGTTLGRASDVHAGDLLPGPGAGAGAKRSRN